MDTHTLTHRHTQTPASHITLNYTQNLLEQMSINCHYRNLQKTLERVFFMDSSNCWTFIKTHAQTSASVRHFFEKRRIVELYLLFKLCACKCVLCYFSVETTKPEIPHCFQWFFNGLYTWNGHNVISIFIIYLSLCPCSTKWNLKIFSISNIENSISSYIHNTRKNQQNNIQNNTHSFT